MLVYEKAAYRLVLLSIAVILLCAFLANDPVDSLQGFLRLQLTAARLISDFTVVGTPGGALLNAAVMGLLALGLVRLSGVSLSGPTFAAIYTIVGFSLFGKNSLNSLPVVLGVFLASRLAGKPFKSYILMALFGTAMGPLFSFMIAEAGLNGLPGIVLGLLAGTIAGFVLPALAMAMLRMHEGFSLYNIGLTSGFFSLFFAAILAASGHNLTLTIIWNSQPNIALILLMPMLCTVFIIWGCVHDGAKLFKNMKKLLKMSGRLPSDFMESVSPGAALVNAGLLGLAGWTYLMVVKADLNGPVLGGLFTVVGFACFGKHPRNCWPVAAGVLLATLVFGKSVTAPGPVLALLFGTTLAPLAGEFGPIIGMAAGFIHLLLVEQSAVFNAGLSLYNNGFAGGLTATLFVALIQWARGIKSSKM